MMWSAKKFSLFFLSLGTVFLMLSHSVKAIENSDHNQEEIILNDERIGEGLEDITKGSVADIISGKTPVVVKTPKRKDISKEILNTSRLSKDISRSPAIIVEKVEKVEKREEKLFPSSTSK